MPEFRKILDVYQGYNFKKDKQTPVGFITKMTIGKTELKADAQLGKRGAVRNAVPTTSSPPVAVHEPFVYLMISALLQASATPGM